MDIDKVPEDLRAVYKSLQGNHKESFTEVDVVFEKTLIERIAVLEEQKERLERERNIALKILTLYCTPAQIHEATSKIIAEREATA